MLKKIIENESAQITLKILLKNNLAGIIEYPSYKILAVSEGLVPEFNNIADEIIDLRPKDIAHDYARFSSRHAKDTHEFRINGITSEWLMTFRRHTLKELELFHVSDVPIFHNKQLVGIYLSFRTITLNDILLIDKLINKKINNKSNQRETCNDLSEMEKEILFFAALNKSNKQISTIIEELGIRKANHNTIKTLISQRIYKKFDVATLDEAIIKAIKSEQIHKIPESFLNTILRDYYLLDTKNEHINI